MSLKRHFLTYSSVAALLTVSMAAPVASAAEGTGNSGSTGATESSGQLPTAPKCESFRTFNTDAKQIQGMPSMYQMKYSAKNKKYFASNATYGPYSNLGGLSRINPDTLEIEATAVAPVVDFHEVRDSDDGIQDLSGKTAQAPLGVEVDDVNNLVWTTDTHQHAISAYDQDTLKRVWTSYDPSKSVNDQPFEKNRDIYLSPDGSKLFVTSDAGVQVLDTKTKKIVKTIDTFPEKKAPETPIPTRGQLDAKNGKLYIAESNAEKVLVIDVNTLDVVKEYPLKKPDSSKNIFAADVAFDESRQEMYVSYQGNIWDGTPNVNAGIAVYDLTSGELKHFEKMTGDRPLSIASDEENDLLYVGGFESGKVKVFDERASRFVEDVNYGKEVGEFSFGISDVQVLADGTVTVVNRSTYSEGAEYPYVLDPETGKYSPNTRVDYDGERKETVPMPYNSYGTIKLTERGTYSCDKTDTASVNPKVTPFPGYGTFIDPSTGKPFKDGNGSLPDKGKHDSSLPG